MGRTPVTHKKNKPRTLKEWLEAGPTAPIQRKELFMVLEGFGFVPAEEIGEMLQRAFVLERERKWYRRLWRWIRNTMWMKRGVESISKQTRDELRAEFDRADKREAEQATHEKEADDGS